MEIGGNVFLVGGAVRNQLLGLPATDKDWVVVGSSPDAMLAQGFKPVGRDFPVFLHPETKEEYALARTERKVAPGYQGFSFYAAPDVSLEADLQRRDLTINAIAMDANGTLIDPFHGQDDLNRRCLRHVSPAFSEDPVRVLRIARFAATFPEFTVAPDTGELLKNMVSSGEVDALVGERVWAECEKTLTCLAPHRFFDVLAACNALDILFPGLEEITGSIARLKACAQLTADPLVRLSVFLAHLSPQAHKHLQTVMTMPKQYSQLTMMVSALFVILEDKEVALLPAEQLDLLTRFDGLRREARFLQALRALAFLDIPISYLDTLATAQAALADLDLSPVLASGLSGKALGEAIYSYRLAALAG